MSYMERNEKSHVSAGPWGGECGARWDDGVYCSIRQMIISHGTVIDSIQIEYDKRGCSVWSEKHGGNGGIKTEKIKLDYPDEYLVSISGYHGQVPGSPVVLLSLLFESNRRRYGPFGFHKGTHFSFSLTGGMIVGFHGGSGLHLDSIGVYVKPFVTVKPAHAQSSAVAQSRMGIGGGGNKEDDTMVAVRNNFDSMFISNDAFREFGRKEKVFTTSEGVKGPSYPAFSEPYQSNEVYGTTRPENGYLRKQGKGYMLIPDRAINEYEEKLYTSAQGSPNGRQVVSYGPWGGNGGMLFDDGVYTGVREIHLARSGGVVSIKVCYDLNGQTVWGNKNGGNAAYRLDKISFDYPNELLTHISGYYDSTIPRGPTVIKSLTFYTNRKKYGPFGDEQGTYFSSGQKDGIVVGFHGRKGWFVDSIGVHFLQAKNSLPRPSFDKNSTLTDIRFWDQVNSALRPVREPGIVPAGMVIEPAPRGPGPWGGDGGKAWDDGVFTGIRKIFLTKGEAIYAIQIEYDRNGQSIWSVKHGTNNEGSCHVIQFEYPHEVLTCISGYYGAIGGDECKKVVKSLTFYTNRGRYGPCGDEIGTYFTSARTEGKIVGFHGKSGCYLYAIGVHMQHWLNDRVEQGGPLNMMLNKIFA